MKSIKTEVKWGIIFSVALLLWMVLEKALGWHDDKIEMHPMLTMIFILPAFVMYYLAILEKREKDYAGQMTWLQGVKTGTIIGVVVAILSPLTQYITHTFITPDYFQNASEYAVESGHFDSMDQARETFNLTSYIVQSVISAVILGAVTGGIVSIFLKKKYE